MFIKQAISGKLVHQDGYVIVPPDAVLEGLNSHLADQQLPNCQFVTACYGHLDLQTCEICLARGGHPHPIHVGRDGACAEVRTSGGLLGIFHGETFPARPWCCSQARSSFSTATVWRNSSSLARREPLGRTASTSTAGSSSLRRLQDVAGQSGTQFIRAWRTTSIPSKAVSSLPTT